MWASALDHEVLNDSVKVKTVVEFFIYELEEVSCSLWAIFGVETNHNLSGASSHFDVGPFRFFIRVLIPPTFLIILRIRRHIAGGLSQAHEHMRAGLCNH